MPDASASLQAACVLGTLPEVLKRAIISASSRSGSGSGGVIAYLCTALPNDDEGTEAHLARAAVPLSAAAQDPVAPRFAVFSDSASRRRWTVELGSADTPQTAGVLAGAWQTHAKDAAALGVGVAAGMQAAAPSSVPITAARYSMLASTWRETPLVPVLRPTQTADKARTPSAVTRDSVPTPTPASSSSSAAAHTTSTAASRAAPASPLRGASLQHLAQQHAALVRRLVQALAPQRQSAAQVIRTVCTTASTASATSGTGAVGSRVCAVEDADGAVADAANAGVARQYTEADVAAAIAVLTTPHPRQPQLRELRSEGFLLMDVDGFADGAARHKAVNRAYPALALHWPSSARLMDAMERYVDRDVVLDTRKRHPALMQTPPTSRATGQHKRTRASSSSSAASSRAASEEAVERTATSASAHARTPHTTAPRVASDASSTPSPPRATPDAPPTPARLPAAAGTRLFHALREYPRSLEPGDLRAWATSEAAQHVRACLAAATALADGAPTCDGPRSAAGRGGGAAATTSAAAVPGLPVANHADVAVLRGRYDRLAAGETVLVARLRAYAETVQELRGWYRADLCAPSFQSELAAWVAGQEECRAALTELLTRVHVIRYRLERDLSDFLHLHALGVV